MSATDDGRYNVLLAVDHSVEAEKALRFFLDTLRRPNADVILLHCFDLSVTHADVQAASYEVWKELMEREKTKGHGLEQKFKEAFDEKKVKMTFMLEASSHAGETIVEIANKTKARYIMMGTRGLGLIRRTILGSVSDFVLHHSSCPVFIYRE